VKLQRAGDLMTAIARLPNDHYVTFNKESSTEEGDGDEPVWLLTACVFQKAPEDGWESRGAKFGHPPTAASHAKPCPPQWAHDDAVIFGVNAEEPETLERLLINAITAHWGKDS
jgi:hypothetical protein